MKILTLSAHTDDAELGCGGTLNRFIREGNEVHYIAFSRASSYPPFPKEAAGTEMVNATAALGIRPENIQLFDFPIRKLGFYRQDILETMIRLRDTIQPDMVFMPCRDDFHQDHITVHEEGMRAFKYSTLLGYEMPSNNLSFQARSFFALATADITAKVAAVTAYRSQSNRRFMAEDAIRSLAVTRGVQSGLELAECFDVIRWVNR